MGLSQIGPRDLSHTKWESFPFINKSVSGEVNHTIDKIQACISTNCHLTCAVDAMPASLVNCCVHLGFILKINSVVRAINTGNLDYFAGSSGSPVSSIT